jgi:hypothetical protein
MAMADMVIALKIFEDNTLAMMNYDKKWPIMDIAALHIVEVLHITVMSNVMGLKREGILWLPPLMTIFLLKYRRQFVPQLLPLPQMN